MFAWFTSEKNTIFITLMLHETFYVVQKQNKNLIIFQKNYYTSLESLNRYTQTLTNDPFEPLLRSAKLWD